MKQINPGQIEKLNAQFENSSSPEIIEFLVRNHGTRLLLTSTFAHESQALTHMLLQFTNAPKIVFLDTGRMFQETFEAMSETQKALGVSIEYVFPEKAAVETMVREKGPNLFYENVENRKLCCEIRKVQPMKAILKNYDVWLSGLRREQTETRKNLKTFEYDESNNIIKAYPILNWSDDELVTYVKKHNLPYNKLHDVGYPSIGCAPCTRPVRPGEAMRSGRWWWESEEQKECGLHWKDGRLIRPK